MITTKEPAPDKTNTGNNIVKREIKFKVWDKKTNIMLQGIGLEQLLGYLLFQNCPNSDAYYLMKDHFKELVWLESTGLKDKNGTEIYEGDIIKSGYLLQKVYYGIEEAAFKVKCINCYDEAGSFLRHWKGEVVGNLHENPELLNSR